MSMLTSEYLAGWPVHSRMGFQGKVSSWLELNPGVIAIPRLRQTAEQPSAEEMMLCSAFQGSGTEYTGGLVNLTQLFTRIRGCSARVVIRTDDDPADPLDYFQTPHQRL
jgi:hypothetical protein